MALFSCIMLLCCLMFPITVFAVVYPDRNIQLNSLTTATSQAGWQFFPLLGGWGELGKYAKVNNDFEHNWNVKLGAAAELLRYNDSFNFIVASDIELVANPESTITFNPRSFFWHEIFMLSARQSWHFWQTGFVHRCKHDIDNLEILDETGERKQAVFIYDSIFLRFVSKSLKISNTPYVPLMTLFYFKSDIFVLKNDDRIYEGNIDPDTRIVKLRYTLQSGFNSEVVKWRHTVLYTRLQYQVNYFSSQTEFKKLNQGKYSHNYLAEIGLAFPGAQGTIDLFINYEYQDYTLVNPYNENAHLLLFGIRIEDQRFFH